MCSSPENQVEALAARDFSCLLQGASTAAPPSLGSMSLYACNDVSYNSNCNSSGQGCGLVQPVTTLRQPTVTQTTCTVPNSSSVPCGGAAYCEQAACNCPPSVDWSDCGVTQYASLSPTAAIEASHWMERVNSMTNFITTYGLDSVTNVQQFLNESQATGGVESAWSQYYGVCTPPSNPSSCDATGANACTQTTVCGKWSSSPSQTSQPYLFEQWNTMYPTVQEQPNCCPLNSTYYAGCCCDTSTSTSCGELKNCTKAPNVVGPVWCDRS